MKRMSLLLFLLFLSNLVYADQEAIIYGKIDNNHSSYIRLEIHNFNPETFQSETHDSHRSLVRRAPPGFATCASDMT